MVSKEIKVLLFLLLLISQRFLTRPYSDQVDSIDRSELDSQIVLEEPEFYKSIPKTRNSVQMLDSAKLPRDASVCPELTLPTS
jgi:hypothetical protein